MTFLWAIYTLFYLTDTVTDNIMHFLINTWYNQDDGMNLSAGMVASSFGKLVMKEQPRDGVREEDLAIALLMMITNNIGQVWYL